MDALFATVADEFCSVAGYQAIARGADALLFDVSWHGRRCGAVLCRVDPEEWGAEFVIVAAVGRLPGVDLTASCLPALEGVARKLGCRGLRFHTDRPGLVAKARRFGYRPHTTVVRKRW